MLCLHQCFPKKAFICQHLNKPTENEIHPECFESHFVFKCVSDKVAQHNLMFYNWSIRTVYKFGRERGHNIFFGLEAWTPKRESLRPPLCALWSSGRSFGERTGVSFQGLQRWPHSSTRITAMSSIAGWQEVFLGLFSESLIQKLAFPFHSVLGSGRGPWLHNRRRWIRSSYFPKRTELLLWW